MSNLVRQVVVVVTCAVAAFVAALAAVASGWAKPPTADHATAQIRSLSAEVASDRRQVANLQAAVSELARVAAVAAARTLTASISTGCPAGKTFYTLYDSDGTAPIPGTGVAICVPR